MFETHFAQHFVATNTWWRLIFFTCVSRIFMCAWNPMEAFALEENSFCWTGHGRLKKRKSLHCFILITIFAIICNFIAYSTSNRNMKVNYAKSVAKQSCFVLATQLHSILLNWYPLFCQRCSIGMESVLDLRCPWYPIFQYFQLLKLQAQTHVGREFRASLCVHALNPFIWHLKPQSKL